MIDREEVIKDHERLEVYGVEHDMPGIMLLAKDAAALLKEQEPVDMVPEGGGPSWWLVCTECHGAVDSSDKFCRHCGRPFKQQKKSKCDGCVYKGGEDCPQSLEIRGDVFCPNGKLG